MFCSSCGATVKESSTFCGTCGKPISDSVAQAPAAPAAGAVVAAGGPPPIVQDGMAAARDTGLYAGFWLRVVAALIDGLLIGIPFVVMAVAIFASALPMIRDISATQNPNPFLFISLFFPRLLLLAALGLVGTWLYWSLLESSSWQATLGKKRWGCM
ncbi:MAG TPA: RDD family protein [Candidatus Acidoferrales bacterium]|nr:RDD family protein [Candidatus Acidoferrales bacterium]